jgi:hypothetical protein
MKIIENNLVKKCKNAEAYKPFLITAHFIINPRAHSHSFFVSAIGHTSAKLDAKSQCDQRIHGVLLLSKTFANVREHERRSNFFP